MAGPTSRGDAAVQRRLDAAERFRAPRWPRLWVPVVVSALVQLPGSLFEVRRFARPTLVDSPREWLDVALMAVGPLALVAARRWPGPVVAVVSLAAGAELFVGGPGGGPPYVALAFAIVSAVVRHARPWAWISVGATWVGALSLAALSGSEWPPARVAMITFGILLTFGIGEGLRSRVDRMAARRAEAERRRDDELQAERVRIARELHDVLAHSLSQISVQAGVGLHLMDRQPEQAAAALASIKETSRSALAEVRSVLGVLRGDEPGALVPTQGLGDVERLAEGLRADGVAVEIRIDDAARAVPASIGLACFRILQESLTNVARHARAHRVTATVRRVEAGVEVEVVDDGRGATTPSVDGRGLLGMRERAELLGGVLEAGPVEAGGFRVAARIPVDPVDPVTPVEAP